MSFGKAVVCSVAVLAFLPVFGWASGTNQTLFIIERSKNANVVHYDARLTPEGALDPKEPVAAYWVMLAEDGRHEGLNVVERHKAYGFDIRFDASKKLWVMTLAAYRKREIIVRQIEGGARAEMVIADRPSAFEKMYIHSTEGLLLPKVNYIEFFGKDLETGEKRYEKFVPD